MKYSHFNYLKACTVLLVAAVVMYSCSKDSLEEDLSYNDLQNTQMLKTSAGSCEDDCIEAGGEIYYPVSDMATGSSGPNTKWVNYEAYNTETDFVVEVTYTITAGPSNAKATITIDIDGDEVEYTEVSSGSMVSHTVALAQGWDGCDEVPFSVVQEGLGAPISFNESYALFPVCEEVALATLTTTSVIIITQTTATGGGNISNGGGVPVTARGVCYSTSPNPTIANSLTSNGTGIGTFSSNLTGLTANTTYYVRAYATNSVGTAYGNEVNFTTLPAIGQPYLGGILAYVLQPGDPGYDAAVPHGLIAAPSNQGLAIWGCETTSIGGTSTAIGTGAANTSAIVSGCADAGIAAKLCNDLDLNGYSDWYLPSKDELWRLYLNRVAIGGFVPYATYWSSTEFDSNFAWDLNIYDGRSRYWFKNYANYVRAVRAF